MKNLYYNDMVAVLMKNPEGMKVRKIARYIYNNDVSLFDFDAAAKFLKIHKSVQQFLWVQSRKRHSPFERKGWGTYALKQHFVVQLELEFEDWEDDDIVIEKAPKPKKVAEDYLMRDLFADHF